MIVLRSSIAASIAVCNFQTDVVVRDVRDGLAACLQLAEQNLLGERRSDLVLYEPRHRTRAHLAVVAVLGEPAARRLGEFKSDILFDKLRADFRDELVNDALDEIG